MCFILCLTSFCKVFVASKAQVTPQLADEVDTKFSALRTTGTDLMSIYEILLFYFLKQNILN